IGATVAGLLRAPPELGPRRHEDAVGHAVGREVGVERRYRAVDVAHEALVARELLIVRVEPTERHVEDLRADAADDELRGELERRREVAKRAGDRRCPARAPHQRMTLRVVVRRDRLAEPAVLLLTIRVGRLPNSNAVEVAEVRPGIADALYDRDLALIEQFLHPDHAPVEAEAGLPERQRVVRRA